MTEPWVVRIRAARTCWTSSVMTAAEADSYREGLRAQVLNAGDGAGMVDFAALGGRTVSVRARDVVAVETSRWHDHEAPAAGSDEARPASERQIVTSLAVHGEVGDGTGFLRNLAGSMARHPAGSRQPVIR